LVVKGNVLKQVQGRVAHRRALGNGYVEGPDAFRIERVSRARKRYECDRPLRAERPSDKTSPGSGGDAIYGETAADCTGFIEAGQLYAYLMPHFEENPYWTAHRMCLKCALKESTIELAE